MAPWRQQMQDAVDRAEAAGMPDSVYVGLPVSLVREILSVLPVETIRLDAPATGATA